MAQIQTSMDELQKLRDKGEISREVNRVYERSLRAKAFHQRYFDRSIENWHMYLGLDAEYGLGQWPAEAVRFMLSKRRHIFTYNLAKVSIERLASSLAQTPHDPDFLPVDDEPNTLTEALKKIMYCDKERCSWDNTFLEMIIAGLVFQGVMRIDIDDTWDPLGNIGFSMCLPNSWYGDPMWKTTNMKDLRICWHEQFLTPDTMYEKWGDRNPRFKLDLEQFMSGSGSYGMPTGAVPFDVQGDSWGNAQRVIHEYRMIRKPTKYEFVITDKGDVRIPKKLEYPDDKINWLNQKLGQSGWQPDQVFEKPDYDNICMKTTICPRISVQEVLDEEECEVQVGHPPFEVYSYDRVNGEPYAIVDSVKDMQVNVNYMMSMKQFRLQMEGFGGAKQIDPGAFASPEEAERAKKQHNDAGAEPFEVIPGYQGKAIQDLSSPSPAASEAFQELENIVDRMWPLVSRNVPAMSGRSEGKSESGRLHDSKVNQAEMGLFIAIWRLRNFWHETYVDYAVQSGQQYSLMSIPRQFYRHDSEDTITLNERVTLEDGSQGIKNDMSALKDMRCMVIISEKQNTPTSRAADISVLNNLIKARVEVPPSSPSIVFLLNTLTTKIDQLSPDEKMKAEALGEMELEAVTNDLMIKLNQQKQAMNPQPQPGGMPSGAPGMPQEAAPAGSAMPSQPPQAVPPSAAPVQPKIPAPKPPQAPMPANIKPAPQRPLPKPPQAAGGSHG